MLRTIHLHRRLGKKFGREHRFDVENVAEAVKALCTQLKGFEQYISKRKYGIIMGDDQTIGPDDLDLNMGSDRDLHIIPEPLTAGLETILLVGLTLITASLAIVTILAMPKVPNPSDRERETRDDSFIIDGPVNRTEQGHPVGLVYGEMLVGSSVVSSGISTSDVNENNYSGSDYVGGTPGVIGGGGGLGGEWAINLAKGGKGGGGTTRAAQEDPNTLQSQATAKVVDVLCEGEIVGLIDGLKSVFFDGTPLQNADDSYNFAGVAIEKRWGLPDQDPMPGFSQTEATTSVATEVTQLVGPITRTVQGADTDVVRVTIGLPALYKQDTTNGDLLRYQTTIAIEHQSNGGGYTEKKRHTFNGKTNSPYQRSFDIRLTGPGPHDIRVKRISPDSQLASIADETHWDLMTEVVEAKLIYPDTALIGVTVDARQFGTNIPERGYLIKGRIIEVPSNYDPVTRVYTGVWDGTFKLAWTDNPAWVFRDLIVNKRFGLGNRVDTSRVDKWGLYAIAQHNDELIPDGAGGTAPRYTINCQINTRAQAYDVLASIASNFRGMVYWGTGSVMIAQDRDEDPTILLNDTNMVGGEANYDRITPLDKRRSVAIVWWNDPEDNYRLTPEIVEDPDLIERFGWEPREEVTAFGVTNRGHAHRIAKLILEDESAASNTGIQYKVGDDHAFVEPGRIAEIADEMFAGEKRGGRVKICNGNSEATLDRDVVLEAGKSYTISFVMPDGSLSTRAVTSSAGTLSTLTLGGTAWASNARPIPGAVWTLESDVVANRLFRVREISTDDAPYSVRAIAHDPTKYVRVEQDIDLSSPNYLGIISGGLVPPTTISIQEHLIRDGNAARPGAIFSWESPGDPRVTFFQTQVKRPSGRWEELGDGPEFAQEVSQTEPGSWGFRVRSIDALGRKSAWAQKEFTLTGQVDSLPVVTGLAVSADDDTLSALLTWNEPNDVRPLRYNLLHSATNDIGTAISIGLYDSLEAPIKVAGHYWVRTEFADVVAATAAHIEVTTSILPEPKWSRVQNAPQNLAALDAPAAADITQAQTDINNLFTTYGSTASAATSANAAAAAQTASETARDVTLVYRNAAQAAQTSAETAKSNAETAETNSVAARTAAESARDTAVAQATAAQGHSSTASGHATTATTKANEAAGSASAAAASATTATTKAGESQSSATAAASSASSAATQAGNAASSASAAAADRLEASIKGASVELSPNGYITEGLEGFHAGAAFLPSLYKLSAYPATFTHRSSIHGRAGAIEVVAGYGGANIFGRPVPIDTSRKYRSHIEIRTETGTARWYAGLVAWDASGNQLAHSPGSYAYCTLANYSQSSASGWESFENVIPVTGEGTGTFTIFPVGTAYAAPMVLPNYQGDSAGKVWISHLYLADATALIDSAASAAAAATSQTTAAASATSAGQSASTAATQAGIATTKAGEASTSASAAASSESNAAGSANTASTQASLATTAKLAAETAQSGAAASASAAAGHSSTAASHASASGTSATASDNSRISAEAANDDAGLAIAQMFPRQLVPAALTDYVHVGVGAKPESSPNYRDNYANSVSSSGDYIVVENDVHYGYGIWLREQIPWESGKKYRLSITIEQQTASSQGHVTPYIRYNQDAYDGNYTDRTVGGIGYQPLTIGQRTSFNWTIDFPTNCADPGADRRVNGRVGILCNRTAAGGTITGIAHLYQMYLEDITSEFASAASASAAAISESNAAASNTSAGQSASTASSQAGIATTKASEAATSAANSAASETNAAGSAATASSQAGIATTARQAAEAAQSGAAASATAASGHSSTAASHATTAGTHATAADQSRIGASVGAADTFPGDFSNDGEYFAYLYGSESTSLRPEGAYGGITYPTTADGKTLRLQVNATGYHHIGIRKRIPAVANSGRRYRLTVRSRLLTQAPSGDCRCYISTYGLTQDYATLVYGGFLQTASVISGVNPQILTTVGQIYTQVYELQTSASPVADGNGNTAVWVLPSIYFVNGITPASSMGQAELLELKLDDITSEHASSGSAAAAATSATTAGAHSTAAGNSATAANADRLAAEAANNTAQTAASNASADAATATAQAGIATTEKTLAAGYATDALARSATTGLSPNATFEAGASHVYNSYTGNSTTPPYNEFLTSYQGETNVFWCQTSTTYYLRGEDVPIDTARTYRVRAKIYAADTLARFYVGLISLDGNGDNIGANAGLSYCAASYANVPTAPGWHWFEGLITGEHATSSAYFRTGAKRAAPIVFLNYSALGILGSAISELYIEDANESVAAAASATASAASAATATAQAAIATSEKTLAASHATNAGNSATAAAASATASESSRVIAAAEAAAAQQSALLSASINTGSLTRNPNYIDWSSTYPNYYSPWVLTSGDTITKVARANGGNAIRMTSAGVNGNLGTFQYHSYNVDTTQPGAKNLIEAEVHLVSGSLAGAGILLYYYDSAGVYAGQTQMRFSITPDATGVAPLNGVVGRTYQFQKLSIAPANATRFQIYQMANWSSYALAAKTIDFYRSAVRAANPAEASVHTSAGVYVDVAGRVDAYLQHEVEAGTTRSVFTLAADGQSSTAAIVADEIALGSAGNVALYISDGKTRIQEGVFRGLTVFPRTDSDIAMEVLLKPIELLGSDGQVIQYQNGDSFGAAPDKIERDISGLPALAAGESYDVKATSITATQFTVRAKKLTSPVTTNQTASAGTNVGGTPQYRSHKPSVGDAYDDRYEFRFTATVPRTQYWAEIEPPFNIYYADWTGTVDIYVTDSAASNAWVKIGSTILSASYSGPDGSASGAGALWKTITKTVIVQTDKAIGQHGSQEFGVHPVSPSTMSAFAHVKYVTQTNGGEVAVSTLIPWSVYPPPSD